MYKNINDYELLYLISENNEDAYNSIYNKYSNIVQINAKKLYRKTKHLGVSYDDIYQAGMYGLTMAIRNFDEKEGALFYTCANTFIVNEMFTFIKNHNRCKHKLLSESISLNAEIDEEGNSIMDFIISDNNIQDYYTNLTINKLLEFKYELTFLQSLIYELRINNFNNREIAILLNVKYKTVDNALSIIKDKLKKNLNKIEVFI